MAFGKEKNRLTKSIAIMKKGKIAYFLRCVFFFAFGGFCVYGIIFLAGGSGFDFMDKVQNPILRHGVSFLVTAFAFGLGGLLFARRFWPIIPWSVFSGSLGTGFATQQEIIKKFGEPDKIKENKTSQEYLYHTLTITVEDISFTYKNVRLIFSNKILTTAYRY